jgi:acid phosphatase family membrane protein YuiD
MYPFWTLIISIVTAQVIKPFIHYALSRKWDWRLAYASGSFPSSHTAGVVSLCLAIGLAENFDSTIFALALAFTGVVTYDSANVRYYAGQNIRITRQLVKDVQMLTNTKLDDPIYLTRVKEVLGHKYTEVMGGALLGIIVALVIYYL